MNNFLSIYDLDHKLVQSFIKSAVEIKNSKNNDYSNFANGKILAYAKLEESLLFEFFVSTAFLMKD